MDNLIGCKFNHLTVLRKATDIVDKRNHIQRRWICKCDCGSDKEVVVRENNLKSGQVRSCGCLKINIGERTSKSNKYDLTGEYGIGYTSKGEEFWFDKEDYEIIKNYCWSFNSTTGYLRARERKTGKYIKFHILIMKHYYPNEKRIIDHISRPKGNLPVYDNRKSNLRFASSSQNIANGNKRNTNKSGVVGVCWSNSKNKWRAYLMKDYKQVFSRMFDEFEDAVKARKEAEEKYFGEFAFKD